MTFGDLFRQVRKLLQLGQTEMARELGFSQPQLSKIESNYAIPSAPEFMRLGLLTDLRLEGMPHEHAREIFTQFYRDYASFYGRSDDFNRPQEAAPGPGRPSHGARGRIQKPAVQRTRKHPDGNRGEAIHRGGSR